MFADPQVGVVYRQEMALGDAEDVAKILSLTANEAAPARLPAPHGHSTGGLPLMPL